MERISSSLRHLQAGKERQNNYRSFILVGMVQSINMAALWAAVKWGGMYRPRLYIPACSAKDIRWINWKALRGAGYEAICFDKDNTLTHPYQAKLHEPLEDALKECRVHFDKLAILSNTEGGPDDTTKKAAQLEAEIGMPVIKHSWKKPACIPEVLEHFNCSPARIVVIGDRLATDVYMANSAGMLSIHTRPLTTEGDEPNAVKIRNLEQWMLSRLDRPYSRSDLQARFIVNKI